MSGIIWEEMCKNANELFKDGIKIKIMGGVNALILSHAVRMTFTKIQPLILILMNSARSVPENKQLNL